MHWTLVTHDGPRQPDVDALHRAQRLFVQPLGQRVAQVDPEFELERGEDGAAASGRVLRELRAHFRNIGLEYRECTADVDPCVFAGFADVGLRKPKLQYSHWGALYGLKTSIPALVRDNKLHKPAGCTVLWCITAVVSTTRLWLYSVRSGRGAVYPLLMHTGTPVTRDHLAACARFGASLPSKSMRVQLLQLFMPSTLAPGQCCGP